MNDHATVITYWHCAQDQRLTRTNPCEHCGSTDCEPAMWADVELDGTNVPLGLAEIADRLHVARATVDSWRARDLLPAANWTVGGRPAWSWDVVATWAKRTGRLATRTITAAVAVHDNHHDFDGEPGEWCVDLVLTGENAEYFDTIAKGEPGAGDAPGPWDLDGIVANWAAENGWTIDQSERVDDGSHIGTLVVTLSK